MANQQLKSYAYKPDQGLNRDVTTTTPPASRTYNPETGKWSKSTPSLGNSWAEGRMGVFRNYAEDGDKLAEKHKNTTPTTSTTQVDSKKQAEKEYIEIEFNTLVGDVSVTPTKKSIRIKVNNTVTISGVGKYLSGNYFVSSVKRTISKDGGYSQSLTVIKNGFGDSLKASAPVTTNAVTPREQAVVKAPASFKVGDTVKIVGNDAVYSNAHEGVRVPDWVKQKTLTIKQVSSDGSRVLLMPITSWTYVKYIQKV